MSQHGNYKEYLTAKKANQIAEKSNDSETYSVLKMIETEAKDGKKVLHIYNNLTKTTTENLNILGYDITEAPQISIQRDGLYYTIRW
jgi:cell fate (sporulation/competence/biofilm development) regulator YmcA (YheA/YmcA/DUF963 family)